MTGRAVNRRAAGLATGLAVGYLADLTLGDPARWHPVAGFGSLAAALERRSYADSRLAGAVHTGVLVTGSAALGFVLDRASRRSVIGHVGLVAISTWAVLGGHTLEREALAVHRLLADDDLPGARHRIRSLVGRDPSALGPAELARAVIESVAENSSDAVVAPLLAGAVAGPTGLLGYRALNTLDAMIGHRNPRYENFGWAAARADDAANWVPARLAAALTAVVAPLADRPGWREARRPGAAQPSSAPPAGVRTTGRAATVWRTVRRDAWQHPSPNAGQVEAAFAGALDLRLGGRNTYGDRVEERGELGDGPPAAVADIPRATRLAASVNLGALAVACTVALLRDLVCPADTRARARGTRAV